MIDFSKIKTFSARQRTNLVTLANLADPKCETPPDWDCPEFDDLVERIRFARSNNRRVILFFGAHVIKNGLSRYLIALMREGFITHIASNGAGSIHDFELCYLGGTSEDVPTAIEDGSFGMWEETGRWMNDAVTQGALKNLGYGASLAEYIETHPDDFPNTGDCVLFQAYRLGVPATYHIAIGADIIHQHPSADFAAIGKTSGQDFKLLCESVARLDGGVFLNFGSGVTGPEVFLKALSIARNLGQPTSNITTANFDLRELGDYRAKICCDNPDYYYRPRKNIVNRPVSQGGKGWHFAVNHSISIPNLYDRLRKIPAGEDS